MSLRLRCYFKSAKSIFSVHELFGLKENCLFQTNKAKVRWEGIATSSTQRLPAPSQHQQILVDGFHSMKCPFCAARCLNEYLKNHVADAHGIVENRCYLCDCQFASVHLLSRHFMQEHSVDDSLTCRLCLVTLTSKSQFVTHLSKHAQVKPFKCSYCEKAYYNAKSLVRHKKSCFGVENPFACRSCRKCYKSEELLREHLRTGFCWNDFGRFGTLNGGL